MGTLTLHGDPKSTVVPHIQNKNNSKNQRIIAQHKAPINLSKFSNVNKTINQQLSLKNVNNNISIKHLQWNIRSLKPEIYNIINQHSPHFITLQETRKEISNTSNYTFYNQLRSADSQHPHGGGIAVGVHKTFNSSKKQIPEAFKNLEILFIQAICPLAEVFIINFYIAPHNKSIFESLKSDIVKWLTDMVMKRPTSIWIISGDFNSSYSPLRCDALKHTQIQEYTFRRVEKK